MAADPTGPRVTRLLQPEEGSEGDMSLPPSPSVSRYELGGRDWLLSENQMLTVSRPLWVT